MYLCTVKVRQLTLQVTGSNVQMYFETKVENCTNLAD